MERMRWVLPLVALVGVAGCAADSQGTLDAAPTSAPAPVVSADTGSVTGQVTDEELRPLPGVEIALVDAENGTALSDAAGAFTINDVPAGSYGLVASRIGFVGATKRVVVAAGETSHVNLTMRAIAIIEPHVETFVDEGYIPLAFSVPSVMFSGSNTLGEYRTQFRHNATEGAVAIVATGTWDKSTPLTATWMGLTLTVDTAIRNYSEGRAPVTTRLFDLEFKERKPFVIDFRLAFVCTDGISCTEDPPNRVGQVAYEQRTRVDTAVFYVDAPPPEFAATPQN